MITPIMWRNIIGHSIFQVKETPYIYIYLNIKTKKIENKILFLYIYFLLFWYSTVSFFFENITVI